MYGTFDHFSTWKCQQLNINLKKIPPEIRPATLLKCLIESVCPERKSSTFKEILTISVDIFKHFQGEHFGNRNE